MVLHPVGRSLDNARLRDFKLGGLRLRDIPGPVVVAGAAVLLLARFTGRPMIAVTGVTGPIGASVVQALDKDRRLRVSRRAPAARSAGGPHGPAPSASGPEKKLSSPHAPGLWWAAL